MSGPSSGTKQLLRAIRLLENATLITLLAAMVGLAASQIVLRNLFGMGITWADPLLRILVLWVGLAGAIVATREDRHISINVLARFLPAGIQAAAHSLTDLFAAAVSGLIAYPSARFVLSEFAAQTIAFAAVPAWICQLILPIAFTAIAVRFLVLAASPAKGAESAGNSA